MGFADSKYQDDYNGAKEALTQFGVSGIRMSRLPEVAAGETPNLSTEPEPEEQTIDFICLILPISRGEPGQQESLEETFGKSRALLCLQENTDPPDGYIPIKPRDFFIVGSKQYQVVSIQEINPDVEFPIIYDCVVSG